MKVDARRAALVILLLASLVYHGARLYVSAGSLFAAQAYPGSPFRLAPHSNRVRAMDDAAAAAGLQTGDEILKVGTRVLRGSGDLGRALADDAFEGRLRVELRRSIGPMTLDLPLERKGIAAPALGDVVGHLVLEFALPLFFLGLGFTVVWLKPTDKVAWILLLMMQTFSNLASPPSAQIERLGPLGGAAVGVWFAFFNSSWAFAMLWFVIAFGEPLPLDRRKPWIKWLVLGPLLTMSLVAAGSNLSLADFSLGRPFGAIGRQLGRANLILIWISMSLFFTALGVKIGATKSADALRRLRILLAGATVAMTPAAIIATVAVISGKGYTQVGPDSMRLIAALMMLIFPLTLAYVVIVHKALGVGTIVRQGLQYALAQRAVRFTQVLMGLAVAFGLLEIFSDPAKRQVDRFQWMGLALLFIVFFQRGANRFRAWIDRRFFREAVDAERILADLGDQVRSIADRKDLLETVSRKIGEALHVEKVAAFVRGESGFVPAFATGYGGDALALEFGDASALTCCVAALQKPQTVYLDDSRSWVRRENIPESDAAQLRELSSEVLIPLRTKTSVEGFLSLGPKSSEAPYSPSDLRLLQSVAHQTAMALDNTRLVEQVASEVAKRERMTREIEIAREVQFTLLPSTPPLIPGLDLAGHCRPAAGIGGDYYDFIPIEGARAIGLAIGDIAGKGIPAALLMAGLQAALRGQALLGSRDLARLMVNINKLIFESSPGNRYATFFYGEYRDGLFSYVNAGHNAPLLLRTDGRIDRLDVGGPVVGLMDVADFTEGSINIGPGDLLLGYTDGVSECMNPQDEEWGEDQVSEVLRRNRGLTSSDLVARIMQDADIFAAGAKQHDDMTLIVMKAQ